MTDDTYKKEEKLYSIGEAGRICKVSAKTLRFYDKIGVLVPDYVSKENGYRYYYKSSLLKIPIIKYYKQMGFKLEEMSDLIQRATSGGMEKKFKDKIYELKKIQEEAHNSYVAVADWKELLTEARIISMAGDTPVSVRYMPRDKFVYLDQKFSYDYEDSIINIEWTNYLDSIGCNITNAVMLEFSSYEKKMDGNITRARIMQKIVGNDIPDKYTVDVGGCMVACVYHLGDHDTIRESYEKLLALIKNQGYESLGYSIERYILDYWTTYKKDEFVTEIILPIKTNA